MEQTNLDSPQTATTRKWSNRILAASLFGIVFFTLFPFWIDFTHKYAPGRSPYLLGGPLRFDGILHTLLNALLFAPFGFALSQFFTRRRRSILLSLSVALIAGAALSYSIEILQLYMPTRDSAWDDVLANTFGALLGMIFGLMIGIAIPDRLSEWERRLEQSLSFPTLFVAMFVYSGVWLLISIPLQQKSHLNNWDPNSYLIIGDDIADDSRWSGAVSRLQVWDRALTADQAITLTENVSPSDNFSVKPNANLLASYDLSRNPPIPNQMGPLSTLVLMPLPTVPSDFSPPQTFVDHPALISQSAVPLLATAVRQSNQFAMFVDCVPEVGNDTDGEIFAVANLSGKYDFSLHQHGSDLFVSFRNGLDYRRSSLMWRANNVFAAKIRRLIAFSYDGAAASLYIDGKRRPESYYLSPGAALVGTVFRVKTEQLVACFVLFDSLVFLPVGFMLGLAARMAQGHSPARKILIAAGIIIPGIALETILVCISGRPASAVQVCVAISLTISGIIWINLDSLPPQLSR